MKLKSGVSLEGVNWRMFKAAIIVEACAKKLGVECMITSGIDSEHKVGSQHYRGLGLDFRTRDFKTPLDKRLFERDVRLALGPGYDVVLEADHLHVEYDPKPGEVI